MEKVNFKTEYIKLSQIIKLSKIVGQGSDAKMLILDGMVKVNEEICYQKGRKIKNNDIISIEEYGTFVANQI